MALSLYQASVLVYTPRLKALSEIMEKAWRYASERKIDAAALLQARLFPDMLPLVRQVQIACGHALRGSARLSGAEPISVSDGKESTFEELRILIGKTLDLLKLVDPKKMEGMENRDITFPVGDETMTLKGADYLLHFSMPNFYFHLTTAYDILRHSGLEIGKSDYMGSS